MYKVVRKIHTHLNIIDSVYKDDKLQFEQPNLNSKNRFNCKQFKCNNGKLLNVGAWERGVGKVKIIK